MKKSALLGAIVASLAVLGLTHPSQAGSDIAIDTNIGGLDIKITSSTRITTNQTAEAVSEEMTDNSDDTGTDSEMQNQDTDGSNDSGDDSGVQNQEGDDSEDPGYDDTESDEVSAHCQGGVHAGKHIGISGRMNYSSAGLPVLCFMILFCVFLYYRYKKQQQALRTLSAFCEKGIAVPPDFLHCIGGKRQPQATQPNDLRRGVIWLMLGAGLMLAFRLGNFGDGMWAVGFIPLFIGLGYLIIWRLRKETPSN